MTIPHKKWAALGVSVVNRNDYADYDYLDKLNSKELKWLKTFHQEFVNANFKHNNKIVNKRKKFIKDIYDKNNSRNRCLFNTLKWNNLLFYCKDVANVSNRIQFRYQGIYEDFVISMIDKKYAQA